MNIDELYSVIDSHQDAEMDFTQIDAESLSSGAIIENCCCCCCCI